MWEVFSGEWRMMGGWREDGDGGARACRPRRAYFCLETELRIPRTEKKCLDNDARVTAIPVLGAVDTWVRDMKIEELDFTGLGMLERQAWQSK